MESPTPKERVTVTNGLPASFAEKVYLDPEKVTGYIKSSVTMPRGTVIICRNSSGDEGRLVLQDDGETRFEGNPEAFIGPFMAMFGDYFEEYINKRVAETLNRFLY